MTDCSLISHSLEGHMFSSLKKSFTIVVEWKATSSIGQLCRRRHHSFGLTSENGAYVGAVIRRHSSLLKVTRSKFNDKPKFLRWKPKEGCLTDTSLAKIWPTYRRRWLYIIPPWRTCGRHVAEACRRPYVRHQCRPNIPLGFRLWWVAYLSINISKCFLIVYLFLSYTLYVQIDLIQKCSDRRMEE